MSRSLVDLHCHSLASDGELSPAEVVERAYEKGIRVISLTDHDTFAGQAEAKARAGALGMGYVSGIEFSCVWNNYTIHILGLGVDHTAEVMVDAEKKQQSVRVERAQIIDEKLQKKGLPETLGLAQSFSKDGPPGRPHFANALVELGAVSDHQAAFKKYLGAGKVGDVKALWPDLRTILGWISAAEGKSVIAHPRKYNMTLTKLRTLIESFKLMGGDALEVIVSGQKQGDTGLLGDLCRRHGLSASLGSDFHSPRFPWADFGSIPKLPESLDPIWSDWSFAPMLSSHA